MQIAVGIAGITVAAASRWLAGYGMFGAHGMMGGGGMMAGYGRAGAGWDWAIGMLVFWAATLAGAALAVRALVAPGPDDPLAVARRRDDPRR
ncbi:MAG TPA: hypothetical protein VFL91_04655 [Thermomicrobiales bacterium]|nr:hypothetical protein [Thermomicrobiales bacterium]